jgi:hypothetical protein
VLEEYLNNMLESKSAAAGWGGDRFAIYQGPRPSDIFMAQLTVWDTAADAKEFFDAYFERTKKRFPTYSTFVANAFNNGEQRNEWGVPAGRGVMEIRGSRVAIVEGVPAKVSRDKVLNMIWQQGTNTRKP